MIKKFNILQDMLWPEVGLCTEPDLYFHLSESCSMSLPQREIHMPEGGHVGFGSYSNLFNIGKWHRVCGLEDVAVKVEAQGKLEVTIFYIARNKSAERLFCDVLEIDGSIVLPVPETKDFDRSGILYVELHALGAARVQGICWGTSEEPKRLPELMLSITTFRREDAVARTVARFETFMAQSALAAHLHLTVVDNGKTAPVSSSEHVTVIANANLGGSGGFSRGLLEAQERQASHCLFMDDDASVHMQAIERTWYFLAYANSENVVVAGALADAQERWKLWENGATFDRICHPMDMGLDLRDQWQVIRMELKTVDRRPHNFYGGWWYYAFPVQRVDHMPFPYFVRGDDVSFSLAHDFDIVTLPGVISHQDEDFTIKESPLTVYLDLRSHLTHHLALPNMEIGAIGIDKIIARFWLRALLACHYETLEAIILAVQDVIRGPDYFLDHADMAERRQQIGALTKDERWQPGSGPTGERKRFWLSPDRLVPRLFMKATLNGHLLPGFALVGNRIRLSAQHRGNRRKIWGASRITYVSIDGTRSYTVSHSKAKAFGTGGRLLALMLRMTLGYSSIRKLWQQGYARMTTPETWQRLLGKQ